MTELIDKLLTCNTRITEETEQKHSLPSKTQQAPSFCRSRGWAPAGTNGFHVSSGQGQGYVLPCSFFFKKKRLGIFFPYFYL